MSEIVKLVEAIGGPLLAAIIAAAFVAGCTWAIISTRLRALEKKFENGISLDIKKIAEAVTNHSIELAKVEARCDGHREWTKEIDTQLKELAKR